MPVINKAMKEKMRAEQQAIWEKKKKIIEERNEQRNVRQQKAAERKRKIQEKRERLRQT